MKEKSEAFCYHHFENLFVKTWVPFTQGCLVPSWLKMTPWFWRRTFLKSVNVFLIFNVYVPLKRDMPLHLNKLEFPSPNKGCFVLCLVEIGELVLEKIFKFGQRIFGILLYPLGKERGPSFEQTWIPFTYVCFVSSSFEIGRVVLQTEEDENVKSLQTDRGTTEDNRWSKKLTWAISSGEL